MLAEQPVKSGLRSNGGLLALVLSLGVQYRKKYVVIIAWLFVLLFLKYGIPLLFNSNVLLYPWAMDCKWIVYLLFVVLWINKYGLPEGQVIYNGSLFFSKVYILYSIYLLLIGDLGREGILMETNYDGFMILMGFCLIDLYKHNKRDWLIFIIATFFTLSRTGFVSLILLLVYRIARKNIFYLLPIIPVAVGIVYFAIMLRGLDSVNNLDRFVFFHQAFQYLSETSIWYFFLGSTPGVSLNMSVVDGFQWYIDNFEELRSLIGIYPFYFHSIYLRLVMTWGIIGFLLYFCFFVKKFFLSSFLPMRYFSLLILIQSISLSVMTIQNVSVLFFMMLFILMSEEKQYKLSLRKTILL